ncbi:unnamed protein product [Closterium sp. Naga37s-1]|nr:unnamed protein product [Closterium sp. Naga37s-1]
MPVHFHRGLYHHVLPSLACSPPSTPPTTALATPTTSTLANPSIITAVRPPTSLHHSQHASPLSHSDQPQQPSDFHHPSHQQHRSCHCHALLFLPNAGLPAFPSWRDTLVSGKTRGREGGWVDPHAVWSAVLPALIAAHSHEAAQRATEKERHHLSSAPPHAAPLFSPRLKLPALSTDYSCEAAERAREALCSLAADVQRGGKGGVAAAAVLQPVISEVGTLSPLSSPHTMAGVSAPLPHTLRPSKSSLALPSLPNCFYFTLTFRVATTGADARAKEMSA